MNDRIFTIELWPLERIKPYPRNARKIPQAAVDKVAESIKLYGWQHEPCWYAVRKGLSAGWVGDRKQSTVWDVPNLNPTGHTDEERVGHSAQKPVELMRRPILNHTERGAAVYDPFLGSGSTLIACEIEGRRAFGLEIFPAYCDMIVRRWQKLAGRDATLESAGSTFQHSLEGRQLEAQDAIAEEVLEGPAA